MRNREDLTKELLIAAAPSGPDKYLIRLIKVDMLAVEMLADIRDLLVEIRDQRKDVVVDFVPPDYGKDGKLT